jgi:hypothetical protein
MDVPIHGMAGAFGWRGTEILAPDPNPIQPTFTKFDDMRLIALDVLSTERIALFFPGHSIESITEHRTRVRDTLEDRFKPLTPYGFYKMRTEEETRARNTTEDGGTH